MHASGEARHTRLDNARLFCEMSLLEMWWRYFALGGSASLAETTAMLDGRRTMGRMDYDLLAHAANERFSEMDMNHPVPYSED